MDYKYYEIVPVAEAVANFAANDPDWIEQAFIDGLQTGEFEAIRRPDGVIAIRLSAEERKAAARRRASE